MKFELKLATKEGRPWSRSRIMRAFLAELELQKQEIGGTHE
jgi:hypothetical protein